MYNTQGMMLRRKLEEQVELQQALELQGRRLLNLQLPDLKNDQLHHHHPHNLPICAPLSTESHNQMNQNIYPPDFINQEASEGLLILHGLLSFPLLKGVQSPDDFFG